MRSKVRQEIQHKVLTWISKSSSTGYILLQQDFTLKNSLNDVTAIKTDKLKINEEEKIVKAYVILHDYEDDVIIEFSGSRD